MSPAALVYVPPPQCQTRLDDLRRLVNRKYDLRLGTSSVLDWWSDVLHHSKTTKATTWHIPLTIGTIGTYAELHLFFRDSAERFLDDIVGIWEHQGIRAAIPCE